MLNWIKGNSPSLFYWPFGMSAVASIGYMFLAPKNSRQHIFQESMLLGAVAMLCLLVFYMVGIFLNSKLPSDLRGRPLRNMSEQDYQRWGGYGIASKLLGAIATVIVSFAMGWLMAIATILLLNTGGDL